MIWRPSFGTKDVLQLEGVDKNDGFRVDDGKNYSGHKNISQVKNPRFLYINQFYKGISLNKLLKKSLFGRGNWVF